MKVKKDNKNFFIKNWHKIILGLLICCYIATLATLSVLRHDAFASNFDLANMDQTIWNTLDGRFFSLTGQEGTVSRFSIHADLILVLLSPLYLLWDNVRILVISSSVSLALGAIPVYFLSQKILKNKLFALVIAAAYLLNPAMQWTDIYDFHGVSFAIPFLLAAFYYAYSAFEEKKAGNKHPKRNYWNWYFIFIFLALLTKEQISLFIAMLGLAIFFVFKDKKIGLITFFIGIFWFIAMVFLVIPYFSINNQHWAFNWYQFSDSSNGKNMLVPSIQTIQMLFDKFFLQPESLNYYNSLLKPFGFLPLLGLPWLLLSLPELSINILSSHEAMGSITLHYDSGITPSLLIAMIFGLSYLQTGLNKISFLQLHTNKIMTLILLGLLVVVVRSNYNSGPLPINPSCQCKVYQVTEEDRMFEKALQNIPQTASITASGNIRPHLTHRENAFTLPSATNSADFVAVLTEQRIPGDYQPIDVDIVEAMQQSKNHKLVNHTGKFYLFKKIH